jgi:hypothetical protein
LSVPRLVIVMRGLDEFSTRVEPLDIPASGLPSYL